MAKCTEKKKFPSKLDAERALDSIWRTNWKSNRKKPCASYFCGVCGSYHLTSQGQKPEAKPRKKEWFL